MRSVIRVMVTTKTIHYVYLDTEPDQALRGASGSLANVSIGIDGYYSGTFVPDHPKRFKSTEYRFEDVDCKEIPDDMETLK